MDITISKGASPFFIHVQYGAGGVLQEAVGMHLGRMFIIEASSPLGIIISGIPVVNQAAVIAGRGPACSCVWAAIRAFARGWGL